MKQHEEAFLLRQEHRIRLRLARAQHVVRGRNIDASLKAEQVIPSQLLALDRLRIGLYGICVDCGQEIHRERLEKVPAAIRCVECQTKSE